MRVFVPYQRADNATAAQARGRALRLGGHEAFFDTGRSGMGSLFRQVIANEVATSHLMFALIGPPFDTRRLHQPARVVTGQRQRARFHAATVVPVIMDGAALPADEQLPAALRWPSRRNALVLRRSSFRADIDACVAAVPALTTTHRRATRVLWVDDRPAKNEFVRTWLRARGIVFDCVMSTDEALEQLANQSYDLVTIDLGRKVTGKPPAFFPCA